MMEASGHHVVQWRLFIFGVPLVDCRPTMPMGNKTAGGGIWSVLVSKIFKMDIVHTKCGTFKYQKSNKSVNFPDVQGQTERD